MQKILYFLIFNVFFIMAALAGPYSGGPYTNQSALNLNADNVVLPDALNNLGLGTTDTPQFGGINTTSSWPGSFGTTPTNKNTFVVGTAWPVSTQIPAGVLQDVVSTITIPSTYTQAPWPVTNFSGYCDNQNTALQSSCVSFYSVGLADGTGNTSAYGVNSVIANADKTHYATNVGIDHGVDFNVLIGNECNPNIWTKAAGATPAGQVRCYNAVGGGNVMPSGGAYAYWVENFATGIPWTAGFHSVDAATTIAVDIGRTGTGNSVGSQLLTFNTRDAGGLSKPINISALADGSLKMRLNGGNFLAWGGSDAGFAGITSRNENTATGTAGIEFSSDPTYSKAAIGLVRQAANGAGKLVFYVDPNNDAANWDSSTDEVMALQQTGTMTINRSLQIGTPTGGDKGAGTLNLAGLLYNNNTAPTGSGGGYVLATGPTVTNLIASGGNSSGFAGITARNNNASTGTAGIQFSSDSTYSKAAIGQVRSGANGLGKLAFYVDGVNDATDWASTDEQMAIATSGIVTMTTALTVGSATPLTLSQGELGVVKITASGTAPGAAGGKLALVCGTNAGTAKLISYAGTSTTPVTIVDNIGGGVSGC